MIAIFALLKQKECWNQVSSAIRPVLHGTDIPVPVFKNLPDIDMVDNGDDDTPKGESSGDWDCKYEDYVMEPESPQLFSQSELNNLVRYLSLSKQSSELLASRLKEKNPLLPGTRISFYRTSESGLLQYFDNKGSFVYCNNIPDLLNEMGTVQFSQENWRLFIDTSKQSCKRVLLHSRSIRSKHSVEAKATYQSTKVV